MSNGTASTLELHPHGLSEVTLSTTGVIESGDYALLVPLNTLDLGESERITYEYAASMAGGVPNATAGKLVDIKFDLIIIAESAEARAEAYGTLSRAITNPRGGYFVYRPEGASVTAPDTYYHYVASSPPALASDPANRWDSAANTEGKYVLILEVALKTQPVATSDPDTPVTITSLSGTPENYKATSPALDNGLTVDGDYVLGTLPAQVRLLVGANSGQELGRIIIHRRVLADSDPLTSLPVALEAESATIVATGAAWSEITCDSGLWRGGGYYMHSEEWYAGETETSPLRFSLANAALMHGRFAVFGAIRDCANMPGAWTFGVKLVAGNVTQEGETGCAATSVLRWELVYLGEFDLPAADLSGYSSGYSAAPYLEFTATRGDYRGDLEIDGLLLVYTGRPGLTEGTALDLTLDTPLSGTDKLLLENLPVEGRASDRAYIADSSGNFDTGLASVPRGDMLMLEPGTDQRVMFITQRAADVLFNTGLAEYLRTGQVILLECEDGATSGVVTSGCTATESTAQAAVGSKSLLITNSATSWYISYSMIGPGGLLPDLAAQGVFATSDYILLSIYMPTLTSITSLQLRLGNGTNYYYKDIKALCSAAGWNHVKFQISGCSTSGSPSLAGATVLSLVGVYTATSLLTYLDYVRIEQADSTGSTRASPIYSEDGATDISLANAERWALAEASGVTTLRQINAAASTMTIAKINGGKPDSMGVRARFRVTFDDAGTAAGIIFGEGGSDTILTGSPYFYMISLDNLNNKLRLIEYMGSTMIADSAPYSITLETGTEYILGVQAHYEDASAGSIFRVYACAASAVSSDDEVFSDTYEIYTNSTSLYLYIDEDTELGFVTYNGRAKFRNFYFENLNNLFEPEDEITVSGQAVFRTVSPFM